PDWRVTALHRTAALVAYPEDVLAERHGVGRRQPLLLLTQEVVHVVQPAVGDEQHVPAVAGALLEQHALGAGAVHGDPGQHRERPATQVHARTQWYLGGVRVVGVAGAFAGQVGPP